MTSKITAALSGVAMILVQLAPASHVSSTLHESTKPPRLVTPPASFPGAKDVDPNRTASSILDVAMLDEAGAEVSRAEALLSCSSLRGQRAYFEYADELRAAIAAWYAVIPRGVDDDQIVALTSLQTAATALLALTTSLGLARERLTHSLDDFPSWLAAMRTLEPDGDRYIDVPPRFRSPDAEIGPIEVADDIDFIQAAALSLLDA